MSLTKLTDASYGKEEPGERVKRALAQAAAAARDDADQLLEEVAALHAHASAIVAQPTAYHPVVVAEAHGLVRELEGRLLRLRRAAGG